MFRFRHPGTFFTGTKFSVFEQRNRLKIVHRLKLEPQMISIESFRRLFIICLYFLDFILLSNLATCKISTAFVLGRREDLS